MALSVVRLKREYEIRLWTRIIEENPYVAVLQMTGGGSWGRTNMKSRILGKHHQRQGTDDEIQLDFDTQPAVNARYAVPKAARAGALRSKRFNKMSILFKTSSSAVVYGKQIGSVADVVKQATQLIKGGLLVGGRFGNDIVTASVWDTVLESDGELQEWQRFVQVLDQPPPVLSVLQDSNRGLVDAIDNGSRSRQIIHVLQRMSEDDNTDEIKVNE